jgi:hypothetical protein
MKDLAVGASRLWPAMLVLALCAPPALASEAPTPAPAPLLSWGQGPEGLRARLGGNLRASYLGLGPVLSDRDATEIRASPFETRVRLAPELRWARFGLVGEADLATGAVSGLPSSELNLGASAHPTITPLGLRQLYFEYQAPTFTFRAGQQTSHWGLGLVANSGAQDARPGEFGSARHGDLVYRAMAAGRPLSGLGGVFRFLEPAVAVDLVARDDTATWADGDRALQGVVALRYVRDPERHLGIYGVVRRQRSDVGDDPLFRNTDARVVDIAGSWRWDHGAGYTTKVGAEAAFITGTSTMARSDTAAVQTLRQLGAAAKASVSRGAWHLLLDLGFASGDHNPYDDRLEAFRFDPDYHAGLVLYDEVLGWQTARAAARASDPELLGLPPEGVDLLPSRGAVHGSWYLFPRARYAARSWLDVYGGPLFAFATSKMTDPFNTRLAGGSPRNALDGAPGNYLGTELDVGLQARHEPTAGLRLTATVEAGYLLPGSAFTRADGTTLPGVAAGRLRLSMDF